MWNPCLPGAKPVKLALTLTAASSLSCVKVIFPWMLLLLSRRTQIASMVMMMCVCVGSGEEGVGKGEEKRREEKKGEEKNEEVLFTLDPQSSRHICTSV